jgi:hypothetical protein
MDEFSLEISIPGINLYLYNDDEKLGLLDRRIEVTKEDGDIKSDAKVSQESLGYTRPSTQLGGTEVGWH